jgi:MFS transporter
MRPVTGVDSYRAVLTLPFALRTFLPALGGRLAYGLLPLATLFTIVSATGSYAAAGLAPALFGITSLALPAKARLTDRLGQRRTLPALALVCAAALTAAATTDQPVGLVLLIGLAGLAAPPLGPAMRATWPVVTLGTSLKQRAYALDSVTEEALYLVGPLLAGLFIAAGRASTALVITALLLVAGTVGMVLPPPGGAAVAPLYVVAYLGAGDLAPDGRGTEAGTWVNVAANAGSAGGSAAAGFLVQSAGPAPAFLAAGVALAAISGMSALRPRSRP